VTFGRETAYYAAHWRTAVVSIIELMEKFISIVIPNYNGASTIGKCLEAALASRYGAFEIVVVDDCSSDDSVEIIKRFPCRLISLDKRSGAAAARNRGAESSKGDVLFFIDADCLIRADALTRANEAITGHANVIMGGTYSPLPYDRDFFSVFQSLFIHYSETAREEPDYIATHAMIIQASVFRANNGFSQTFMPILEDVEFSHRLRRNGFRLIMIPDIQVMHVFHFTLMRSLMNAFRKSMYWTMYSLMNRDLLADSGTASAELKFNGITLVLNILLLAFFQHGGETYALVAVPVVYAVNLFFSRGLIATFYREKGYGFTVLAVLYYTVVYPIPVVAGAVVGILKHTLIRGRKRVTIPL
jgi:glycosyltransferase involved in cell wall biosynthesis